MTGAGRRIKCTMPMVHNPIRRSGVDGCAVRMKWKKGQQQLTKTSTANKRGDGGGGGQTGDDSITRIIFFFIQHMKNVGAHNTRTRCCNRSMLRSLPCNQIRHMKHLYFFMFLFAPTFYTQHNAIGIGWGPTKATKPPIPLLPI